MLLVRVPVLCCWSEFQFCVVGQSSSFVFWSEFQFCATGTLKQFFLIGVTFTFTPTAYYKCKGNH